MRKHPAMRDVFFFDIFRAIRYNLYEVLRVSGRYLMWVLGTFTVTLFLCTHIGLEVAVYFAIFCVIAILPIAITRFSLKATVISCLISAVLSVGLFVFSTIPVHRQENQLINQEVEVEGTVMDIGSNSAKTLERYQIKLSSVNGEALAKRKRFNIYLYTESGKDIMTGSTIRCPVSFFDSAIDYGFGREDLVYVAGYQSRGEIAVVEPSTSDWRQKVDDFRITVQNRISYGSEKTQGLLRSVCFGDKSDLDSSLSVSLRRDGLSHVTAVSGLHLTFAVALFGFFFVLMGIPYRVRSLLNIFVALFFTVLVGFPLSCIRACVMLSLYSIGMAINEQADGLTSLSVAAFLIVLVQPMAVRDVGFLLSVLATFGILTIRLPIENFMFPKKLKDRAPIINSVYRKFTGIIACSLAAAISTLPISLFVFESVSLIAPIANVVLILPFQLLFELGIFMVLLGSIPGVGTVLGFLCDILCAGIEAVAQFLGKIPFASVSSVNYIGILLIVLFLGILGISLYHFLRYRRRSFIALFLMFLCFCGLYMEIYQSVHSEQPLQIAFVNVGQGDCTVLSKDGKAVILDYGGTSSERYNLINYLKKMNVSTVELLAFTHLHNDHTNGLSVLLQNVYVDRILYPELNYDSPQVFALMMEEDAKSLREEEPLIVLDNVTLYPIMDAVNDPELETNNERCVCYRVEYGSTSVLVTGDIEARAEMKILSSMEDCTLLKVAHHGSKTSSMYPFLKTVSPEIAVISVGENSYGLPDESVISRLETICPMVYNTSIDGTVVFQTDGAILERVYYDD